MFKQDHVVEFNSYGAYDGKKYNHSQEWNNVENVEDLQELIGKDVIYLAGPMTGLIDCNHKTFNFYAKWFRACGFDVRSPVEIEKELLKNNPITTVAELMDADLRVLMGCQAIALLEGWENSKGSKFERLTARRLGKKVYYIGNTLLYSREINQRRLSGGNEQCIPSGSHSS